MTHIPPDVGAWLRELAGDDRLGPVADHLAACRERGLTRATLASKLVVLRRAHLELSPPGLLGVTAPALRAWWRRGTYRSPAAATRAKDLSHLRTFFRWAIREDLRGDDPSRLLDAPRVPRRLPRPADERAVRAMLGQLEGSSDWLPIALAAHAGLRVSEIAAVTPAHVRTDIAGAATLRVTGKGGHDRVVPLPPELAARLLTLPPPEPAVRGRYGEPFTPDGLSRAISRIMREHGVTGTAHRLRATFGTRVYRASRDLLSTQRLLGHAQPGTTAGYAAVAGVDIQAAAEGAWDTPDPPEELTQP